MQKTMMKTVPEDDDDDVDDDVDVVDDVDVDDDVDEEEGEDEDEETDSREKSNNPNLKGGEKVKKVLRFIWKIVKKSTKH